MAPAAVVVAPVTGVVGAAVVAATVVGAAVVGATVVGAAVVGAAVVGATVVGAAVVGATVVGAAVVAATVVVAWAFADAIDQNIKHQSIRVSFFPQLLLSVRRTGFAHRRSGVESG